MRHKHSIQIAQKIGESHEFKAEIFLNGGGDIDFEKYNRVKVVTDLANSDFLVICVIHDFHALSRKGMAAFENYFDNVELEYVKFILNTDDIEKIPPRIVARSAKFAVPEAEGEKVQ